MCRPTRPQFRGRLTRLGEMSEDDAQPLHRGTGASIERHEHAVDWHRELEKPEERSCDWERHA
jgi:hypothetical protein